jgi:acyl carrier protein
MQAAMNEELVSAIKQMLITDLFVEMADEQIGPDDGLHSVLGLDSVGLLELRVLCEKRYAVAITDEEFAKVRSVRTLAELVERLRHAGSEVR